MIGVLRFLFSSALLIWTVMLALFHSGVMYKPQVTNTHTATSQWYDRKSFGIHNLVLTGPDYERGLEAGALTKHLLLEQEDALNDQLDPLLPQKWMRQAAVLGLIAWFQGIDRYLPQAHIEEMYGVSQSAPAKYNYLADPLTRQVAYHGLHEVGQMMVDQGFEGMGCTVAAIKRGNNWVLGRNFDFEGGRIFDREKIVKWVFPDQGYAFVSVIWAGMVGAVTGVNEKGVYISINAAGSDDFARVGTPSTLVILRVLQEAATTEEAVAILEKAPVFISDIFVVSDAWGKLMVVEKTPKRVASYPITKNGAVANHFISDIFAADKTNQFRKEELTSIARLNRARQLTEAVPVGLDMDGTVRAVLDILRDKGVDAEGQPLTLGNRRAIDALIATHAVILDGVRGIFYVSKGPALVGEFQGYDLEKSFRERKPVPAGSLPPDPRLSDADFHLFKDNTNTIARAHKLVRAHRCVEAIGLLESVRGLGKEQSAYYHTLGDAQKCLSSSSEARAQWQKALTLTPAYAKEERELKRKLQ